MTQRWPGQVCSNKGRQPGSGRGHDTGNTNERLQSFLGGCFPRDNPCHLSKCLLTYYSYSLLSMAASLTAWKEAVCISFSTFVMKEMQGIYLAVKLSPFSYMVSHDLVFIFSVQLISIYFHVYVELSYSFNSAVCLLYLYFSPPHDNFGVMGQQVLIGKMSCFRSGECA